MIGHQHSKRKNIARDIPFSALDKLETVLNTCETEFDKELLSAEDITSIPNASKSVILLKFAGGLQVKLCVWALENRCFNTSIGMAEAISSANFPRVLLRGDGWAAFEWIDGKTVSQYGYSEDIVRQAAGLLKVIHTARIPAMVTSMSILEDAKLKLEERLAVLVSNDVLSEIDSQTVIDLGNCISARGLNISLIHGDFSPTNLVVSEGELWSVDNEKMRIYVTDYDLCRAVTFWDEYNLSGHRLLDCYAPQAGSRPADNSLLFWGVFDLVYRISYRVSSFGEFDNFCITRLRQMLRTGTF